LEQDVKVEGEGVKEGGEVGKNGPKRGGKREKTTRCRNKN